MNQVNGARVYETGNKPLAIDNWAAMMSPERSYKVNGLSPRQA